MKVLIRWLADISGVTDQIEEEAAVTIGYRMHDASKWIASHENMANCMDVYAEFLKQGQLSLFGFQFELFRSRVVDFKENKEKRLKTIEDATKMINDIKEK